MVSRAILGGSRWQTPHGYFRAGAPVVVLQTIRQNELTIKLCILAMGFLTPQSYEEARHVDVVFVLSHAQVLCRHHDGHPSLVPQVEAGRK